MNRYILVGPLLLFVALALAACGSDTSPAAAPGTATHDTAWVIGLLDAKQTGGELETPARVILEYSDTTAVYVPLVVSSPPATNTPVPTVTLTPPPTNTPRPTATPTASRTPDIEPSPTQEGDGTPITPVPTLPPVEEPGCYGAVTVSALTIREGPATIQDGQSVSAPSKGIYWRGGDRIRIDQVVYVPLSTDRVDEWIHAYDATRDGWSAAFYSNIVYVQYDVSDECRLVRWGTEQPTVLTWHAIPGGSASELVYTYGMSQLYGIPYGVKSYADIGMCRDALVAGGWCILRNPPGGQDCPNVDAADPRYEARHWMGLIEATTVSPLRDYMYTGRFIAEPTNECRWDDNGHDLEWWRDFMLEAIDYAEAHNWPPMVLPSLGPGWGDLTMFRVWEPALRKLAVTGNYFGMHAYSVNETPRLCDSSVWLGYRHRLNHGYMAAFGYSVPIMITEAAREWGGSSVDEEDMACWYHEVATHDPYVRAVSLWLFGKHTLWPQANLEGHTLNIVWRAKLLQDVP